MRLGLLLIQATTVSDVLQEILAHKREEVERAKSARPLALLRSAPTFHVPCRNFYGAVTLPRRDRPNLIAEIKRRSPSGGPIRPDLDPVEIAQLYERSRADALSVLTDEKYFGGRIEYIEAVKAAVGLPVLRKDFIVDPYQVYESRAFGADAILLIAEALDVRQIAELIPLARMLGLWVLLEVHDRERLDAVVDGLPDLPRSGVILGINNRNLRLQQTNLETTEQLAPLVPYGVPVISESGIKTRRDIERLYLVGARALLIGETLLRAPDPGQKIKDLFY